MKVLDVDLLQEGLTRNLNRITRLEKEMTDILQSVEGLVALDDALKGEGGQAIRDFYQSCHVPFLHYFLAFTEDFRTVLEQMSQALTSLESMETGHIVEDFLKVEVEDGLTRSVDITRELTDEANALMYMVADIVSLPKLDDSHVQESVADAKRKRDVTVEALHTFDRTQTNQLESIELSIQSMKEWLENIDGLFKQGLTDVNFPTDQWTSMVVGSEITRKLTARGLSVGNILSKNEASLLIEQAIRQKIVVDEYCDMNEVSKIAGTYYTLADGRILRKFYGPSGAVTYTFVGKIPKDKVGGASTEDSSEGVIDSIQLGLDVLGLIPGLGEIADGVNGIIYTARGEKINAALSFSAMIPFLGWAGTAGKWINKGVDAVGGVSAAVGKAEKVGKFALHYGGKTLEKIKNVLHPDKVKKVVKKVYDDYIKYPIYKSYMSLKDEVKKIKNLQTPFADQVATTYGNLKIQKTVSEVVQDTKESIVQMAKKLDEAIGGTGSGKFDPLSNPKIAKEIESNSDAVYGYSPKKRSPLDKFGVDWTNQEQVASARAKRMEYLKNMEQKKVKLESEVAKLQSEGMSIEEIARKMSEKRNLDRMKSYDSSNSEGLAAMKERNIQQYGREEGPTPEQLFEKYGSWEEVIYGSLRTSPAMDVLTGLYKE